MIQDGGMMTMMKMKMKKMIVDPTPKTERDMVDGLALQHAKLDVTPPMPQNFGRGKTRSFCCSVAWIFLKRMFLPSGWPNPFKLAVKRLFKNPRDSFQDWTDGWLPS